LPPNFVFALSLLTHNLQVSSSSSSFAFLVIRQISFAVLFLLSQNQTLLFLFAYLTLANSVSYASCSQTFVCLELFSSFSVFLLLYFRKTFRFLSLFSFQRSLS